MFGTGSLYGRTVTQNATSASGGRKKRGRRPVRRFYHRYTHLSILDLVRRRAICPAGQSPFAARAAEQTADSDESTVRDAATRSPVTVFPDQTLREALARMLGKKVGRLLVVDRNDPSRLMGIWEGRVSWKPGRSIWTKNMSGSGC